MKCETFHNGSTAFERAFFFFFFFFIAYVHMYSGIMQIDILEEIKIATAKI